MCLAARAGWDFQPGVTGNTIAVLWQDTPFNAPPYNPQQHTQQRTYGKSSITPTPESSIQHTPQRAPTPYCIGHGGVRIGCPATFFRQHAPPCVFPTIHSIDTIQLDLSGRILIRQMSACIHWGWVAFCNCFWLPRRGRVFLVPPIAILMTVGLFNHRRDGPGSGCPWSRNRSLSTARIGTTRRTPGP